MAFSSKYLLLLLLVLLQYLSFKPKCTANSNIVTECTNPNGEHGFCKQLANCYILQNQLNNTKAKKFLSDSKCGPKNEDKKNPYVCCVEKKVKIFPKNCGFQNVTIRARLLGGRNAVLGEFPWLARLYHKNMTTGHKEFGCTAFLITSKFLLTAAHCLKSENTDILGPIFEVRLGEHDIRTDIDCTEKNTTCAPKVQTVRIMKTIVHPKYRQFSLNHLHDIGLIYLQKSVKLTKYVSTICLLNKLPFEPFEYWLGGWGQTETEALSPIKKSVTIPPFSREDCRKKFRTLSVKINTTLQICAGGQKKKDSCVGDSGGPLMITDGSKWYGAGIVSYGIECGEEGWPGIYTNVTSYMEWIENEIRHALMI